MLRRNLMESQHHNQVRRAQDEKRAELYRKKQNLEDELRRVNDLIKEIDSENAVFRHNTSERKENVLRDTSVNTVGSGPTTGRRKTLVREQQNRTFSPVRPPAASSNNSSVRAPSVQLSSTRSPSLISDRPTYSCTSASPLPVRCRPSTVYSRPPSPVAAAVPKIVPRKLLTSPLPPAVMSPESPNIIVIQSPQSQLGNYPCFVANNYAYS
eukprot:TRINITY_DN25096_c0_g1_i1.p1 TRINITY_DN25096_c0_g1~~TRINITY_DN25096_c0_g1_i1.p1  ORF type:complete len:237 (+),score=28.98 TRINITY_DN25096_c0_g1_i1:81-713(+)